MILQSFVGLCFLFLLINANPIDRSNRISDQRSRRSVPFLNWQFADSIYKRFSRERYSSSYDDKKSRNSEFLSASRPVEGPMNIEQLPAMIASRNVKRYPYSQQDDPAVIGR